jgi:hypothetical protein
MIEICVNQIMRSFLLTLFLSLSSFASTDYSCSFRNYRLDLDMTNDQSTGLFLHDSWRYETLYVGYVGAIERSGRYSNFFFYGNEGEMRLQFLNTELAAQSDSLNVEFEGQLQGFYFLERFSCRKRLLHIGI